MISTRVVILTGDAGFGHRKSACAIAQALLDKYGETCAVEIVNPMDDKRVLAALRSTQAGHDRFARNLRGFYDFWWSATSKAAVPGRAMETGLALMLFRVIWEIVNQTQPDVIVTTYPLYHPPLAAVFAAGRRRIPLVTVVTDLGDVHRVWYSRSSSFCLVATPIVRRQAIACGLAPERVRVTGIPVDPAISRETRARDDLRRALGWRSDWPVVLAVGSKRVVGLRKALAELDGCGVPLQLAIVAGGDQELYSQLCATGWRVPAYVYSWVDNMPELLRAADCVVAKAGGLIISEALACGLPLIIIEVMPDQERGNAQVVIDHGAGEFAENEGEVASILCRWLADGGALLAERARRARGLGRPHAAATVADLVWQLAGKPAP